MTETFVKDAARLRKEELAFIRDSLAGWRTREELIIKLFIFLNFFKFMISKREKKMGVYIYIYIAIYVCINMLQKDKC